MLTGSINVPITIDNILSPKIKCIHNVRISVAFKGRCLKQDKATFAHRNVVYLFIFYKLETYLLGVNANSTLKDCLFGAFNLTENVDPDKYSYSG